MSPDQDEHQLHPSSVVSIEMPAASRGWSPIAQSDDEQPTAATATTAITSTPKKPQPANSSSSPAPAVNGHHSSHLPPASATAPPPPTANGHGHPTTANGNGTAHNGLNGRNGSTRTANGTTTTNGGTAKTANNNDLWSPASQNGEAPAAAAASAAASATGAAALPSNGGSTSATNHQSPSRIEKNGWKELPQEEPSHPMNGHPTTANGNGNGAGAGQHTAEEDPLTGVVVCTKDLIDPDELSTCGIGACQPKWARAFASTKSFMFVFLIAWVLQGMYSTYVVSVITTIEKLFQIKSKTSGMLLSAIEVGQISTALLLSYFAGQGHRPRWIACGMVLFAVCAFGCSIPHFMYGDELLRANNALYSQVRGAGGSLVVANGGGGPSTDALVSGGERAAAGSVLSQMEAANRTYRSVGGAAAEYDLCLAGGKAEAEGRCGTQEEKDDQETHAQITYTVLTMLVFCMLGVGVGQTAVATLGIPFIDDNVASRESAIYIAITIGVRILGPTSGFMLGSVCTRLHVSLLDPGYGPEDPKWVGAWYLGLVIIPTLMIIAALAMFTFPRNLRGQRIPPPVKMRAIESAKKLELQEIDTPRPRLRDFPKTIRRQLSNDILMFRTASSVLHLLPVAGLYTFLPKYLESQFQMAAHESSMITGTYGILVMGVGIVISGVVILKCSPTAKSVAAYIAFTAIVYSAGMATLMFFGCSMDDFIGIKSAMPAAQVAHAQLHLGVPETLAFVPPCNVTCDCDFNVFEPICGADGKTYFSACHAGCLMESVVGGRRQYKNCSCIPDMSMDAKFAADIGHQQFEATLGHCDSACQSYFAFIALFSFLVFMHSTSEVGSMLLIMRCTDPKDKAMAMGIIQFAIGLFGNVPCPIIYGAVIDSTCLVWDTICGKQGACKQYDKDAFRHFFFGTTSGIMFLAFVMDLIVWHKAHRIDIDPEKNASSASSAGAAAGTSALDVETAAAEKPLAASSAASSAPDSSV